MYETIRIFFCTCTNLFNFIGTYVVVASNYRNLRFLPVLVQTCNFTGSFIVTMSRSLEEEEEKKTQQLPPHHCALLLSLLLLWYLFHLLLLQQQLFSSVLFMVSLPLSTSTTSRQIFFFFLFFFFSLRSLSSDSFPYYVLHSLPVMMMYILPSS